MKTYTGGCHCKSVRYEADIEELKDVISCNCSLCSKRGWLLTFVSTSSFRLLSGKDSLTTYHFNKNLIDHLFCKTCGTASYGIGKDPAGNEMVAINVRCLDDVDLSALTVSEFNGKDI
ncbi:GFA family protein [Patescibacteria group bacterium]|nr:GFA family protein [Patescibacteria group bacterium]MBU2158808.1 GFA family protein [Patescibacteria group bacterium]MBU2220412.1 GFA family protein [Patescibacteria group bacterium]